MGALGRYLRELLESTWVDLNLISKFNVSRPEFRLPASYRWRHWVLL